MGLFPEGEPLDWSETKRVADIVRQNGIKKFIEVHNKNVNRNEKLFKWGDEIEYMVVKFDHHNRKVRLSLRAKEILKVMDEREESEGESRQSHWMPEFGLWVVEGTPGQPYGMTESDTKPFTLSHLLAVEANMKYRRRELTELLTKDEALLCLTSYPRLGTVDYTDPNTTPNPNSDSIMNSLFTSDDIINDIHPRVPLCTKNMRLRRDRNVVSNIPIFKDCKTADPFVEVFNNEEADRETKVDHIFMDSVGFGMGCCCLQVTFQGANVEEAKHLYDQLAPLTPIALALTAASPIFKGYLTDRDCRWEVICDGMDDRTYEELGEKPLKDNSFRIKKSRYDSINSYLSDSNHTYNDIEFPYNREHFHQLVSAGVGQSLAKYVAYKFIRDPLAIYREKGQKDTDLESDHFDNNFPSLRFKPPPSAQIGWRVEFRTMELQSTEAENASFSVFIILMTRAILALHLNLLIPMSKVDENMISCQRRDSVMRTKFWFRNNVFTERSPPEVVNKYKDRPTEEAYIPMTINEIINGKGAIFPGLVPLIRLYIKTLPKDVDAERTVDGYLKLIEDKASGKVKTTAQWIRDFVRQHKDYKHDSVVNDSINYDLMVKLNQIQNGQGLHY